MHNKSQAEFSNMILLVTFLVIISVIGILAGIIYFDMNTIQSVLYTIDFKIPMEINSSAVSMNLTTFQDILGVVAYPILGLKDTLPYLTYFMVFGLIIAMGVTAYLSSRNPLFFILHLLFTLVITYFCFILSNSYATLLAQPFINQMMLPFTIYNKLMLYLPQIVFFTSMVFGAIAFINLIKPQSNLMGNQSSLNYGGDY
jgi:hypothetical protein